MVFSLLETARANGINSYKYLEFLLESRPNEKMTDKQLESLSPWNENVKQICKCKYSIKMQCLICNSKIIQIRLILILCGQTGICQITFFIVPFFQSTIIEHLQIILDDKRNDIIFQTFLEHN